MENEQTAPGWGSDFRALLGVLPVWILVAAAIDVLLVRFELPNQPVELVTFLHGVLLWAVFGLAALIPALIVGRLRPLVRASLAPGTAWNRMLFWMGFPIGVHMILDRYTVLGQNVSRLMQIQPWLEVAGALIVLALLTSLVGTAMRRLPSRKIAMGLAIVATLVGCFLPLRASADSPPVGAASTSKPNILLLVWDTTRPDHLTPYGYSRQTTPELSTFAEESLVFDRARSVSIFTFTSHLSMLTGKYPAATGARLYRMRLDPTLSESVAMNLAQAGYRTGAFVGTWVLSATTGIQRGFEVYDDRVDPAVCFTQAWSLVHDVQAILADKLNWIPSNGMPHWFQDFQRPAEEVLMGAREWIERDDPRPWFCMINLYDVHWPYVPKAESREQMVRPYSGPMDGYLFRSDNYQGGYVPNAEDGRHIADLYDAEMLELDAKVGAFLTTLKLDESNTSVILTADHGEAFGEAGRFKHEDIIEPQVRVPLCIRLPGSNPESGLRSVPSSGIDIGPTILGLAGLPVPDDMHGVDLLNTELDENRPILVEDRDHESLADVRFAYYEGPWKFVRMGMGENLEEFLFNLDEDPVGQYDLAQREPTRFEDLRRRMDEMRAPWISIDNEVVLTGLGASADALGGLGYLGNEDEPEE